MLCGGGSGDGGIGELTLVVEEQLGYCSIIIRNHHSSVVLVRLLVRLHLRACFRFMFSTCGTYAQTVVKMGLVMYSVSSDLPTWAYGSSMIHQ